MFKYKYHNEFVDDREIMTRFREGTVFKLDKPNKVCYARSISYQIRQSWNMLPSYPRCNDDHHSFKVNIKAYHTNLFFEGVEDGTEASSG